uniref:Thyrotropin releasing hormone n=1 Tax=Varanus komodoensis TaxID=61221 RepID=A0A8D2J172_VARKO
LRDRQFLRAVGMFDNLRNFPGPHNKMLWALRKRTRNLPKRRVQGRSLGASQLDWMSKRQHPGKRSLNDLEKRQHPGKREEDNEFDHDLELQKRQHPGRRSLQLAYLNELSKRQHPGKRYLAYSKRQHPGKRSWDDEVEEGELILERRQHPGKRNLASESLDYKVPCDPQDSLECSKSRLLLELLDNVSKGGIDEKQQQPGRRSPLDEEVEAEE